MQEFYRLATLEVYYYFYKTSALLSKVIKIAKLIFKKTWLRATAVLLIFFCIPLESHLILMLMDPI